MLADEWNVVWFNIIVFSVRGLNHTCLVLYLSETEVLPENLEANILYFDTFMSVAVLKVKVDFELTMHVNTIIRSICL